LVSQLREDLLLCSSYLPLGVPTGCYLQAINWDPKCFADLFAILQRFHGGHKCFLWVFFAAQSWALWTTRNKFSIEAKFPSQPANSILKTNVFLQMWRPLQKPEALPMLDEAATKLKEIYASLAS
jgi:hypothetical protein